MAFFWIFFLFLFQNATHFIFFSEVPALLLTGIIFFALREGPLFGFIIGIWAGFFLDLFGLGGLGVNMFLLGVMGALSGKLASKIFWDSIFAKILLPPLVEYGTHLSALVFFKMRLEEEWLNGRLFWEALSPLNLVLTAVFAPLVFSFLAKVSFVKSRRVRLGGTSVR
jgi:rod shape-determining protein MreD